MSDGLSRSKVLSLKFPRDFLFGVANADHQVEAHDPEREDVWDLWERSQNLTPRKKAVDFWNRYPEDIARAAALGTKIFRFSIAWSRVQTGPGEWDEKALQHYREVAECIRGHGMEVMVTLVHFTWPVWLEKRGGLIAADFPDIFADYAEKVADCMGDIADYWITFNEPTQLVYGFIKPWWQNRYYMPPGLPEGTGTAGEAEAVGKLIRNLFLAHARARVRIKGLKASAQVGVNPLVTGFPPWLQSFLDHQVRSEWLMRALYRFSVAEPLITGRAKIDLVIGAITEEAHRNLSLSDPYVVTGKAVLVRSDSLVTSLADLGHKLGENGLSLGYVGSTSARDLALTHYPEHHDLQRFADYRTARKALADGKIAALYGDEFYLLPDTIGHRQEFRFVVKGLTREAYSVGVPLGHLGLLSTLNQVIADFQCEHFGACELEESLDAEYATTGEAIPPLSLADYFANDQKPGRKSVTDGEGLRRIRRRGFLKVGIRQDAPGICESCPVAGLEIKLAQAVAQAIFGDASKVQFVNLDPAKPLKAIETRISKLTKLWHFTGAAGLIANSNWWYLGSRGKLPESLCPPEAYGTHDFVGLDYYWGLPTSRLLQYQRLVEAGEGRFLNAPVWPEGLGHALRHYHRWFPNQKIMVIENGCVPLADGVTRQEYLRAHLAEVAKACEEGVPVSAYLCWSLTSNREWGHAFTHQTDFGLYHVGLDTDPELERHASPEVAYYRDLIAAQDSEEAEDEPASDSIDSADSADSTASKDPSQS